MRPERETAPPSESAVSESEITAANDDQVKPTALPIGMGDLLAIMERPQSRPDARPVDLEAHSLANLVPTMSADDYKALVGDIRSRGLMHPVVLYEGKILDGRHRYRACIEVGRGIDFAEYTGKDPIGYVLSENLNRRHMTPGQISGIILKSDSLRQVAADAAARKTAGTNQYTPPKSLSPHGGEASAPLPKGKTTELLAKELGIGKSTLERVKRVQRRGAGTDAEADLGRDDRSRRRTDRSGTQGRNVPTPQGQATTTAAPRCIPRRDPPVREERETTRHPS